MKRDLQKIIGDLFKFAYQEEEADIEYQDSFAGEGSRKAQYIVDDLLYREARGQLLTRNLGYLSIGGADGSEVEQVLTSTGISKAVMIEISGSAVRRAAERVARLTELNKQLVVFQGDATAVLESSLRRLEDWCTSGEISGLVCSAQGVLHELSRRSPGFDLPVFLGKLYRNTGWQTYAFYSREPCVPKGWPEHVRIRIPGTTSADLVRVAQYIRDRLKMSGSAEALASNWVALPALLAVETLHKLLRGNSIRRIGYELGEQLTEFDPMAVKRHLESYLDEMRVAVEYITTAGFKKALQNYDVEYIGHDSESLSVPKTHAEIVGFGSSKRAVVLPESDKEMSTQVFDETPKGTVDVPFSNPFNGDVPNTVIKKWLGQFEPEERLLIARLLDKFTYISLNRLRSLTRVLHSQVQERLGDAITDAWFVPLGGAAKSGGMVSYFYRVENSIPATRFRDYAGLATTELKSRAIVLLDDLLATGHQAAAEWDNLQRAAVIPTSCRTLLATLVSCEAGALHISERTELEVLSAIQLTRADEPLDSAADLFPSQEDRVMVRNVLRKYGERLAPAGPFGYAGSGLLLGFAHSTPDNSLPIFWSTKDGWLPLLRSGGSQRMGLN